MGCVCSDTKANEESSEIPNPSKRSLEISTTDSDTGKKMYSTLTLQNQFFYKKTYQICPFSEIKKHLKINKLIKGNPRFQITYNSLLRRYKSLIMQSPFIFQIKKHSPSGLAEYRLPLEKSKTDFLLSTISESFKDSKMDQKFVFPELWKSDGEWKVNQKKQRYLGKFDEGLRHGYGVLLFPNGTKYKGSFQNDFITGRGEVSYPDGLYYKGSFEWNLFNGMGELAISKSQKYVGEFRNGKPHGRGQIRFANGDVYLGNFENGNLNGQGVLSLKIKRKFHILFENGILIKIHEE